MGSIYINQNKGGNWIKDRSKHDTVVHRLHKPCCTFVCGAHMARRLDSWVPSVNSKQMNDPNGRGYAWGLGPFRPIFKVQNSKWHFCWKLLQEFSEITKDPPHCSNLLKQPPFMQFFIITRTVMTQYLPETITILPNLCESS